jgi:hypothetical protein
MIINQGGSKPDPIGGLVSSFHAYHKSFQPSGPSEALSVSRGSVGGREPGSAIVPVLFAAPESGTFVQ